MKTSPKIIPLTEQPEYQAAIGKVVEISRALSATSATDFHTRGSMPSHRLTIPTKRPTATRGMQGSTSRLPESLRNEGDFACIDNPDNNSEECI